jgi:WD40 repeat protein
MLDGSDEGEINALAITREGEHFISGGEEKEVKIWDYDGGLCQYSGIGHSGHITKVIFCSYHKIAISPNQEFVISGGSEGAIFIWHMPDDVKNATADKDMPTA